MVISKKISLLFAALISLFNTIQPTSNLIPMFTQFETERLIIRKLELSDVQDCFAILSDYRVVSMNGALSLHTLIHETESFILDAQAKYALNHLQWLAVEEKNSHKMIGMIGFETITSKFYRAEIAYAFAYDYWGKGYATEAIKALVDLGFRYMNLNRIFASVDPENARSIRVLEKLGMQREGYLRQNIFHNNAFRDRLIYSILKEEWLQQSNNS